MSADHLAGLLRRLRTPTVTADTVLEFTAASRSASPEVAQIALLQFGGDLLAAMRSVYNVQIAVAELDNHDGGIH